MRVSRNGYGNVAAIMGHAAFVAEYCGKRV
jgi:hypothetical protein